MSGFTPQQQPESAQGTPESQALVEVTKRTVALLRSALSRAEDVDTIDQLRKDIAGYEGNLKELESPAVARSSGFTSFLAQKQVSTAPGWVPQAVAQALGATTSARSQLLEATRATGVHADRVGRLAGSSQDGCLRLATC